MKVFNMARCLMKMRPVTRPGRVETRKAMINDKTGYSLMIGLSMRNINMPILIKSVWKQAMKRRKKLKVSKPSRSPLSERTLQTPTFRALAIPRLAETIEVK